MYKKKYVKIITFLFCEFYFLKSFSFDLNREIYTFKIQLTDAYVMCVSKDREIDFIYENEKIKELEKRTMVKGKWHISEVFIDKLMGNKIIDSLKLKYWFFEIIESNKIINYLEDECKKSLMVKPSFKQFRMKKIII